jgi:Uma2 family endonuclease
MSTKSKATIEDLYRVEGKAELVNGEIIEMPPTGHMPNRAAGSIYFSLRNHERISTGQAYTDNVGFKVALPHRKFLSPDVAWYTGNPTGMQFIDGAPRFAVEVRSENDYGPKAEQELAAKRADYFTTGTLVVWDVDLLSEDVVKVYRADDPNNPKIYRRGEMAEAEPAVTDWSMPVDDLFK